MDGTRFKPTTFASVSNDFVYIPIVKFQLLIPLVNSDTYLFELLRANVKVITITEHKPAVYYEFIGTIVQTNQITIIDCSTSYFH